MSIEPIQERNSTLKEDEEKVKATGGRAKYRQIVEGLRDSIVSGEYSSGKRLPSESELVRRFGVSRMTVVKAVKELEYQGLVTRRVGSGTFVSPQAGQERKIFGLLIPELGQTEIFEPICQGMASFSGAALHSLLWGNSALQNAEGQDRAKEDLAEDLGRQYVAQRVSGVFFAPLELSANKDEVNRRIVAAFDRAKIPVVLLDRCLEPYPERSRYDLVGIDNRRAAFMATMHLVRGGAKRIAFLGKQFSASTVDARIAGYREALMAAGAFHPQEDLVLRGEPSDQDWIRQSLAQHRPDAFVCANDHTAAMLMQILLRIGFRVPEQIRIVGFDDVKYAHLLPIPLTTQHQPCLELGRVAMATMLERMQIPDLPRRDILLDTHLVVRASCGVNASANKEV